MPLQYYNCLKVICKHFRAIIDNSFQKIYNITQTVHYIYGGIIMKVTKDSIIGDVLDNAPETAKFFLEIGMHCLGCPSARGESIAEACAVHGTDADALIKNINDFLAANEKK